METHIRRCRCMGAYSICTVLHFKALFVVERNFSRISINVQQCIYLYLIESNMSAWFSYSLEYEMKPWDQVQKLIPLLVCWKVLPILGGRVWLIKTKQTSLSLARFSEITLTPFNLF